jgi:DNA mismatch repair protein MutL
MSSFGKYDCTASIKSATIILNLFYSSSEMELSLSKKQALKNTGFVFEDNNSDHIVISGILLLLRGEVSIVLNN